MKVTFVITLGERDVNDISVHRTLNISLYDKIPRGAKKEFKGGYTDDFFDKKSRVNGVQYWVDTDIYNGSDGKAKTLNNSLSIAIESIRNTKLEEILS